MIVQPKNLRAQAFDQLESAREKNAGAWPRPDVENAFARAQILATLAVEEQVRRLTFQVSVCAFFVIVVIAAVVVALS